MTTQKAITLGKQRLPAFDLRLLSLLLVAMGLLVSGYLSYVQITGTEMVCAAGGQGGCNVVQNSVYAELFGIKIAYLGLATYIVIGGLIALQERIPLLRQYGMLLTFGVVLFAFIYSVYLVYIQAVVLRAFCQWCLAHEAIMTVLFVVTSIRTWRYFSQEAE
ncbi:vitamin K epoxide reductase family protein [bacterium]|nr:vitamin K epoxide reductase family protein [bacterium]